MYWIGTGAGGTQPWEGARYAEPRCDCDSGGSHNLRSKDGLGVEEIIVKGMRGRNRNRVPPTVGHRIVRVRTCSGLFGMDSWISAKTTKIMETKRKFFLIFMLEYGII